MKSEWSCRDEEALRGQVALVTGGTSGIGLAIAKALASRGTHVLVGGRDGPRLAAAAEALGSGGEAIAVDVADPASIVALMAQVHERQGRIDVLVVAAGVSDAPPIGELTPARYAALMDVNCRGAAFTFVHALPLLSDGASVLFIGSVGGRKGQPGDPLYAGSKGFIRSFVRSAGTDRALLARRIRVNSIAPGPIATPMTQAAVDDPQTAEWIAQAVPMGRWGEAE